MSSLLLTHLDVSNELESIGVGHVQCGKCVTLTGVVKSRRNQKQKLFVMMELCSTDNKLHSENHHDLQLVIDYSTLGDSEALNETASHLRVGARVTCTGSPGCDREGSLSVYVKSLVLLRCAAEPDAIRRLLLSSVATPVVSLVIDYCAVLSCDSGRLLELQELARNGPENQLKLAIAQHCRSMVSIYISFHFLSLFVFNNTNLNTLCVLGTTMRTEWAPKQEG